MEARGKALTGGALAEELGRALGLSQRQAKSLVAAYFEVIAENLPGGVLISGLGRFGLKKRGGRLGRNLNTGQTVEIPEEYNPSFTLARSLRTIIKA